MKLIFRAALVALVLDQASKYWVVAGLDLARVRAIDVLPPFLNLRYGENRGINFGILDNSGVETRWLLVALSVLICLGVLMWMLRGPGKGAAMRISAGLLIGGALGNVADRVLHGYVFDFLNMSCCGIVNPFVFNLADVCIFAGAIGLIVFDSAAERAKRGRDARRRMR